MTRLQAYLLGIASCLTATVTATLFYTALALLNGWETVSGLVRHANAAQAAFVGMMAGVMAGALGGHWWWPTRGRGGV